MVDYTLPVKTLWTDHTQGAFMGTSLTVNSKVYTAINTTIGVAFGLAQPRIERILSHVFGWIGYKCCGSGHAEEAQTSDEESSLLERASNTSGRSKCHSCDINYAKYVSILPLLFGTGYIIAGSFVTKYPDGEAALSNSRTCGAWGLVNGANPTAQNEDALYQGELETRVGQYARDCYGQQSPASLTQCLLFKQQKIASTRHTGEQCPFENNTYCWGDGYAAAKFTTDLVDSKHIGINANNAPKFNRTTICVPLDLDAGFVEDLGEGVRKGEWGYRLGPVSSDEYTSEYTFRQYGDPFTYDVRSYTMSTYVHTFPKNTSQNYWQPIDGLTIRPELNSRSDPYSITLVFINSCRIFYKEASDDPVFPADRKYPNTNLWISNDSRAQPLACIDWIEMCTAKGKCVPPYPVGSADNEHDDQFNDFSKFDVFTRFSLNKSTTFNAIEFRGATGLDAQYKIRDDASLPLAEDQWILESWSLFNTSLSRIQYDAFDIANGTGWDNKLYVPKMPSEVLESMCRIFEFQIPKDYNNIRIAPRIVEVGILLVVAWGLGHESSEEFNEEQKKLGRFEDMKILVFEQGCRRSRESFIWCISQSTSRQQPTEQAPQNPPAPSQDYGALSASNAPRSGTHSPLPSASSNAGLEPPQPAALAADDHPTAAQ